MPLDANLAIPSLTGEDRAYFEKWFGASSVQVSAESASLLHAKALLRYFRELLSSLPDRHDVQDDVEKGIGRLKLMMEADLGLDELLAWRDKDSDDWSLRADDEVPELTQLKSRGLSGAVQPETTDQPKRRIRVLPLLLLLAGIAIVLYSTYGLFFPEYKANLLYPHYLAVVPSSGAGIDNLKRHLESILPQNTVLIVDDEAQVLTRKVAQLSKSLEKQAKNPARVLQRLAAARGFVLREVASDGKNWAEALLAQSGFLIAHGSGEKIEYRHAADGRLFAELLASLSDDDDRRDFHLMRETLLEYQSFKDAVRQLEGKSGIVVRVDPTEKSLLSVTRTLAALNGSPQFTARPLIAVFDGNDAPGGGGGGEARYILTVDRQSYWRQVSVRDRDELDVQNNRTNDKMRWKEFPAHAPIQWQPINVLQKSGRTTPVASFDIAVVMNSDKVVVFRNQHIFFGETAPELRHQVANYLAKGLGLANYDLNNALSIKTHQSNSVTGALIYSYLANVIGTEEERPLPDVVVVDRRRFQELQADENAKLNQ